MLNATRQFRHTLDLKKDEERERRRRMIRAHARVVRVSNLIYVDLPVRIGFSYTSDDSDLHRGENGVSNDLYDFLQDITSLHLPIEYTKETRVKKELPLISSSLGL